MKIAHNTIWSNDPKGNSIRFSQIWTTVVGFSLGAHAMGMAGHYLSGELHRITGTYVESKINLVGFHLYLSKLTFSNQF